MLTTPSARPRTPRVKSSLCASDIDLSDNRGWPPAWRRADRSRAASVWPRSRRCCSARRLRSFRSRRAASTRSPPRRSCTSAPACWLWRPSSGATGVRARGVRAPRRKPPSPAPISRGCFWWPCSAASPARRCSCTASRAPTRSARRSLLTLEAPLTALLAAALFREYVSRRVWVAVTLITIGAATLAYPALAHRAAPGQTTGDLFVVLACLAWALDNSLSRKLADRDPLAVVAAKGLCGASLSLAVAFAAGWITIDVGAALRLLAVGAVGYGLSLQLYLRAQRIVGAARTASVFAAAPFVGVAVAMMVGTPWPGAVVALSAGLMAVGHVASRDGASRPRARAPGDRPRPRPRS